MGHTCEEAAGARLPASVAFGIGGVNPSGFLSPAGGAGAAGWQTASGSWPPPFMSHQPPPGPGGPKPPGPHSGPLSGPNENGMLWPLMKPQLQGVNALYGRQQILMQELLQHRLQPGYQ